MSRIIHTESLTAESLRKAALDFPDAKSLALYVRKNGHPFESAYHAVRATDNLDRIIHVTGTDDTINDGEWYLEERKPKIATCGICNGTGVLETYE